MRMSAEGKLFHPINWYIHTQYVAISGQNIHLFMCFLNMLYIEQW